MSINNVGLKIFLLRMDFGEDFLGKGLEVGVHIMSIGNRIGKGNIIYALHCAAASIFIYISSSIPLSAQNFRFLYRPYNKVQ